MMDSRRLNNDQIYKAISISVMTHIIYRSVPRMSQISMIRLDYRSILHL